MKLDQILQNKEAIIYDCDGTLVDTEVLGVLAAKTIMSRRFFLVLTLDDERAFYGVPDLDYYTFLVNKYALPTTPEDLLRDHNSIYDGLLYDLRTPLLGISSMVLEARRRNLIQAVCSGSYRYQVETLVKNLGLSDYFSLLVTAEDTKLHKPHPEPYLFAAAGLGIVPSSIIAVEDSRAGVTSAKSAGMYCIGVMIGNQGTQDLSLADLVVDSLDKLF